MRILVVATSVTLTSLAAGDPKPDLQAELVGILNTGGPANDPLKIKPPRLILDKTVAISPADYTTVVESPVEASQYPVVKHPIIATAADGTAAWIAVDVAIRELCAKQSCDRDPDAATGHATALFEPATPVWQPIAWDSSRTRAAKAKITAPSALDTKIDAGAEDVVAQLRATMTDPAAFAKTVSDRKDAVLYGSELAERFVGGAAIRAQLAKWKLGFKLRDGIQAGATASKTVAFVAANVDAARVTDKTSTPYRMFAIYEKTGGAWKLVLLQFS